MFHIHNHHNSSYSSLILSFSFILHLNQLRMIIIFTYYYFYAINFVMENYFNCNQKSKTNYCHYPYHLLKPLRVTQKSLVNDVRFKNTHAHVSDPMYDTTLISSAQSLSLVCLWTKLIQHLLSWCYYYGSLVRDIKKHLTWKSEDNNVFKRIVLWKRIYQEWNS